MKWKVEESSQLDEQLKSLQADNAKLLNLPDVFQGLWMRRIYHNRFTAGFHLCSLDSV